MDAEKIVKSSEEQAVAAWIDHLNELRFQQLEEALARQDMNLANALVTMEQALSTIKTEIIGRNRGGATGMHGFIAEIAESGIGNARQQITGKSAIYEWVNDNGPDDLRRGSEAIQQKFVQSGGHLSLQAVAKHLRENPEYYLEGHKYQIPKDFYEKVIKYLEMPESEAKKLSKATGELTLREWKDVHGFFEKTDLSPDKLEGSILEYGEVQAGAIDTTFKNEIKHLKQIDREQKNAAYTASKPTLAEGAKAAVVSGVVEGTTTFVTALVRKRQSGKQFKEFDQNDWMDIAKETGVGSIKGNVRGIGIYTLTNAKIAKGPVANAVTTAAFGVAEQAHLFRTGNIDEKQFIENAELLSLDAAVSALSSMLGDVLIPIPFFGAVIGNAVGTMLYQIGKDSLSTVEKKLIEDYRRELAELDETLKQEYSAYVEQLNRCFAQYLELLDAAFDPDIEKALDGSVALAKYMGVPEEEILDSYEKIESYFLD